MPEGLNAPEGDISDYAAQSAFGDLNLPGAPGGAGSAWGTGIMRGLGDLGGYIYDATAGNTGRVLRGELQPGTPEFNAAGRDAASVAAGLGGASGLAFGAEEEGGALLGTAGGGSGLLPEERLQRYLRGYQQAYGRVAPPDIQNNFRRMLGMEPLPPQSPSALTPQYEQGGAVSPPVRPFHELTPDAQRQQVIWEAQQRYSAMREAELRGEGPAPVMSQIMEEEFQRRLGMSAPRPQLPSSAPPPTSGLAGELEQARSSHQQLYGRDFTPSEESEMRRIIAIRRMREAQARGLGTRVDPNEVRPPGAPVARPGDVQLPASMRWKPPEERAAPPLGKVTVQEERGHGGDLRYFNFLDEQGNKLGEIYGYEKYSRLHGGTVFHVDMMKSGEGAQSLGRQHIRDIRAQLKAAFPGTKGIEGFRISGARHYTGKVGYAFQPWMGGVYIPFDDDEFSRMHPQLVGDVEPLKPGEPIAPAGRYGGREISDIVGGLRAQGGGFFPGFGKRYPYEGWMGRRGQGTPGNTNDPDAQ
jgi:hypothetical protein